MFLTFSISAIMILFCSKMDQLQLHLRLFKVLSSLSVTPNTWLRLTAELCDPIVHVEYYHFVSFITYNLAQPLRMVWSHCISWIWFYKKKYILTTTRSSWLNCALRDDEAVYWVSIGHNEAAAVGNWWYWVSRGHSCLYILHKVEIWTGVTDASLTDNFER